MNENGANVFGEWFAVTHRIAGVGIDHVEGRLLVVWWRQVGFDDADVLQGECLEECALV